MAVTYILKKNLELNEWGKCTKTAATTPTDGVAIDMSGKDFQTVIIVENSGSGSATVTVKAGNGIQGVNDLAAYTLAASEVAAIRLDSGAFKNVTGDNKGKVLIIPSTADVKFTVIELA